jgi:hypothetical protein
MSLDESNDVLILDIDRINALASYVVTCDEDGRAFVFRTDHGLKYTVSFSPDHALGGVKKAYSIIIAAYPQLSVKSDPCIQQTICAILSKFFQDHTRVVSYACSHEIFKDRHETDYPYQTLRSRLFNIWYAQANKDALYEKLDVSIDEGECSIFL